MARTRHEQSGRLRAGLEQIGGVVAEAADHGDSAVWGQVGDESADLSDAPGGADLTAEQVHCFVAEFDRPVEVGPVLADVGSGEQDVVQRAFARGLLGVFGQ